MSRQFNILLQLQFKNGVSIFSDLIHLHLNTAKPCINQCPSCYKNSPTNSQILAPSYTPVDTSKCLLPFLIQVSPLLKDVLACYIISISSFVIAVCFLASEIAF